MKLISGYNNAVNSYILLILITTTFITLQLPYMIDNGSDDESKDLNPPDRVIDYEFNVVEEEKHFTDISNPTEINCGANIITPDDEVRQKSQEPEISVLAKNSGNFKVYTVYYLDNDGISWILLADNLQITSYV